MSAAVLTHTGFHLTYVNMLMQLLIITIYMYFPVM